MERYEYKDEQYHGRDHEDYLRWLNERGQDGWQAIHFYSFGQATRILFKRKITT